MIRVHYDRDDDSVRVLFACVIDSAVAGDAATRVALLQARARWYNAAAARGVVVALDGGDVIERPSYAVAELVAGFSQRPL